MKKKKPTPKERAESLFRLILTRRLPFQGVNIQEYTRSTVGEASVIFNTPELTVNVVFETEDNRNIVLIRQIAWGADAETKLPTNITNDKLLKLIMRLFEIGEKR